ncbi:hypothetical protein [Draconibacterium sp.]|uniref:hypothetical protein n=1 Tax=Draconibacterium sp. TaxID=1965318 RepID=UPI0035687A48
MKLKEKFKEWNKRRKVKKAMRRMNRNVTRSKIMYAVVIYGGIAGFFYGIASIFTGWPRVFAFTPVFIIIAALALQFLKKNWKLIWLYVRDMEQGRLLLYLNDHTVWSHEHKMKVLAWVYLRRKTVRKERSLYLSNKLREGEKLCHRESIELGYHSVFCPQQILDGVNKAILIDALIWAHRNVQVLDDNLREILDLTDENIKNFSLQREINKCRKDIDKKEEERLLEIGRKRSKKLNGSK